MILFDFVQGYLFGFVFYPSIHHHRPPHPHSGPHCWCAQSAHSTANPSQSPALNSWHPELGPLAGWLLPTQPTDSCDKRRPTIVERWIFKPRRRHQHLVCVPKRTITEKYANSEKVIKPNCIQRKIWQFSFVFNRKRRRSSTQEQSNQAAWLQSWQWVPRILLPNFLSSIPPKRR